MITAILGEKHCIKTLKQHWAQKQSQGGGAIPPSIGLSTKMQKENTTFLALQRQSFARECTPT